MPPSPNQQIPKVQFLLPVPTYALGPRKPAPDTTSTNDASTVGDLYRHSRVEMIHIGSNRWNDGYNPAIPTRDTKVEFDMGTAKTGEQGVAMFANEGKFVYGWVRTRGHESIMHHLKFGRKKVVGRIVEVQKGYWFDRGCNYEGVVEWWLE